MIGPALIEKIAQPRLGGRGSRAASCIGKAPFATFTEAARVARRKRKTRPRKVYHCPHCRKFHLAGARP